MRDCFTARLAWIGFVWMLCVGNLTPRSTAHADLVIFNLGGSLNGTTIDGAISGPLTVNGLTALLTANDGLLNATTTNFGINAAGSGDAADMLDAGSGINEFLTITFDQRVAFTQLSLDSFSGSERASLTIGLNPTLLLDASPAGTDVFNFTSSDFPMGNTLEVGQSLRIGYAFSSADDNGFSLEGFQVNTVPEPSCLGCLLPVIWGYLWRRKRF
jgi:hypothetical protein